MRGGERQRAFDFEIGRDRQLIGDRLHGDVMHGKTAVARDQHDALAHGFVVERARLGRDGDFGFGEFAADGAGQPLLDGGDAVERQRAADADGDFDEQHRRRPGARARAPRRRCPARGARSPRRARSRPPGAVSVSVSMVRRPSRQPAMQMKTATTKAAAASARE